MMQIQRLMFRILLGFFLTGTVLAPHVMAADKIHFSIQDATTGPNYKESGSTNCSGSLDIGGTYTVSVGGSNETITIAPIPNSGALARIICDEANDMLILKNARITTTTAPATNVKISFWRSFDEPPLGTASYSVSADGNFAGNPNGSWLSLRGYIGTNVLDDLQDPPPNPPTCTMQLTRCATAAAGTWPFTSQTFYADESISLVTPRTLRGTFWFKLAGNTNQLNFSSTRGIQVKFGPPPGPIDICDLPMFSVSRLCNFPGERIVERLDRIERQMKLPPLPEPVPEPEPLPNPFEEMETPPEPSK